jgi:hypothetical protein
MGDTITIFEILTLAGALIGVYFKMLKAASRC